MNNCVFKKKINKKTVKHSFFFLGTSTEESFKSIFEGKEDILKKIDIKHGFLFKLEECRVITRLHRSTINVN